jgi:glutathione-regulated potassium-efflux system ancillary protein KefC
MDHHTLLQVVYLLLAGVIGVIIFQYLKLGSVLAYLITGVIVGPHALAIVTNVDTVTHLSELGVVMLLFVIGLELSKDKLKDMKESMFKLGPLQVIISTLFLFLPALMFSDLKTAILVGMSASLSSTALALQLLSERNLGSTPAGRGTFGVLLFQDLAVIPMLALLPLMSNSAVQTSNTERLVLGLQSIAVIAIVIFGGRYLLKPFLRLIAITHVKEAFTATALLLVLGVAMAMSSVGLSMALGTFLAGILLADSEYRHELEVDIEPFKGILLGLFFMAAGMSLNLKIVSEALIQVIAIASAVMLIKYILVHFLGKWSGFDLSQRIIFGLSLCQIGEFALVLFATGKGAGIIDERTATILGAAVVLSMMLSPILMKISDIYILPRLKKDGDTFDESPMPSHEGHVILAGVGRVGQIVARILQSQRIPLTILEHDPSQIKLLQRFGYKVFYGDATRMDLLESAGAAKAKLMVIATNEQETNIEIAKSVRAKFPQLPLVVRARNRQGVFEMLDLGVSQPVRETFPAALEIADQVLRQMGMSAYRSYRIINKFKKHDEEVLIESSKKRKEGEQALVSFSAAARLQLSELMKADLEDRDELVDTHWG